jgi:surface antigen
MVLVRLGAGSAGQTLTRLVLCLIASIILSAGYARSANAQMLNPFGGYNGPTLGKDDYIVARNAVATLLNEAPPAVGRYEHWKNPTSGNHGKFTIVSIFTSKGLPCRKVSAEIIYSKAGSSPRSFALDACKLPSGEWKTTA